MKQRLIASLLLSVFLAANSTLGQKRKNEDINLDRVGSLATSGHLELWTAALKDVNGKIVPKASGLSSTDEGKNWLIFVTVGDKLWKGDEFQTAVSTQLLGRIPLISKQIFDEWSAALTKSAGEKGTSQMFIFLLLLRPDRLFDGKNFKTDEFKNMTSRLGSITPEDASKWADATRVYTIEAPVSLIEEDGLFSNNILHKEAFRTKLDEIQKTKKKK